MPIRAQSADGVIHEFPDGTSGAVIDRAMRQYAMESKPKAEPDPYADKSPADIQKLYRGAQLMGGDDKLKARLSDAYVRREMETASPVGKFGLAVDDVVRTAASGVPILGGVLDEAAAGASSLMGGNYEESLDYQRARDRLAQAQPGSTAVQLAGGVGGTLAGMRGLGVGYGATAAGAGAVTRPLLSRAATGALVGAPVGAADFYARGEGGAANRMANAALGAVFGGVTGAGAPVVAQGLTSGAKRVFDFLASDANLRRLGISREAANVLIRQLSTDDTLTQTGAQRIREAGPDAMLADAGPSATNLLDTALERSGPGSTGARRAIENRAANANAQFTGQLDQTFGAPVAVEAQTGAIRQGTAGARRNAYDAAYAQPIDYATAGGREVENLLTRVPQEAINQANRLMRAEGQASRQIRATLNQDGTVTYDVMPDVRQLDYITRALNEVARGAEGQGALGGTTAAGRIYGDLSRDIRTRLRTLVPEYGQALDTAADPIRRIQATEFGATILNPNVTRDEVARQFAGMGAAERQAAVAGMRADIDETIANVQRMVSDPNLDARQLREGLKALSSDAARAKVETAVGQQAANRFFVELGRQSRALELRASVARNSRTFGRTSTDQQVRAQTEPGIIGLAMQGEVPRAIKKLVQSFTGMTPERQLAMEDRLYGEIADALTRVRGQRAERYLQALLRAVQTRSTNRRGAEALGTVGGDAFVGASATPPDRLLSGGR